jgi:paired amphipathic helix protein Sin3a
MLPRITTPGVIEQVKRLFRGHNKLILGFNTFLPEGEGRNMGYGIIPPDVIIILGYKIELSPEELAIPQQIQQQHAISYVTNIRKRFLNEPEIYK